MNEELSIDFYRDRDENAFLTAYEEKYGELTDDQLDELYQTIAQTIHEEIKAGTHELGDPFYYQDVLVGESDFNQMHALYLFTSNE